MYLLQLPAILFRLNFLSPILKLSCHCFPALHKDSQVLISVLIHHRQALFLLPFLSGDSFSILGASSCTPARLTTVDFSAFPPTASPSSLGCFHYSLLCAQKKKKGSQDYWQETEEGARNSGPLCSVKVNSPEERELSLLCSLQNCQFFKRYERVRWT